MLSRLGASIKVGKKMNWYTYIIATSKAVPALNKKASEQVRLIAQLNEEDKSTVMNIIDTTLTKQKFQIFFEQNIAVI